MKHANFCLKRCRISAPDGGESQIHRLSWSTASSGDAGGKSSSGRGKAGIDMRRRAGLAASPQRRNDGNFGPSCCRCATVGYSKSNLGASGFCGSGCAVTAQNRECRRDHDIRPANSLSLVRIVAHPDSQEARTSRRGHIAIPPVPGLRRHRLADDRNRQRDKSSDLSATWTRDDCPLREAGKGLQRCQVTRSSSVRLIRWT